ncbi:MAG: hypothetical protein M5U25_11230 [Planctomycetota bacterium]|nr:hypothetical protein [Planctomycetota bacterium]
MVNVFVTAQRQSTHANNSGIHWLRYVDLLTDAMYVAEEIDLPTRAPVSAERLHKVWTDYAKHFREGSHGELTLVRAPDGQMMCNPCLVGPNGQLDRFAGMATAKPALSASDIVKRLNDIWGNAVPRLPTEHVLSEIVRKDLHLASRLLNSRRSASALPKPTGNGSSPQFEFGINVQDSDVILDPPSVAGLRAARIIGLGRILYVSFDNLMEMIGRAFPHWTASVGNIEGLQASRASKSARVTLSLIREIESRNELCTLKAWIESTDRARFQLIEHTGNFDLSTFRGKSDQHTITSNVDDRELRVVLSARNFVGSHRIKGRWLLGSHAAVLADKQRHVPLMVLLDDVVESEGVLLGHALCVLRSPHANRSRAPVF